jgi:hypothetical protein
MLVRVVILDVQRRSNVLNGWTDMSICPLCIGHTRYILWIIFLNTLNMLKYARIYSNISLSDKCEAYWIDKMDVWMYEQRCLHLLHHPCRTHFSTPLNQSPGVKCWIPNLLPIMDLQLCPSYHRWIQVNRSCCCPSVPTLRSSSLLLCVDKELRTLDLKCRT